MRLVNIVQLSGTKNITATNHQDDYNSQNWPHNLTDSTMTTAAAELPVDLTPLDTTPNAGINPYVKQAKIIQFILSVIRCCFNHNTNKTNTNNNIKAGIINNNNFTISDEDKDHLPR
jgi:hypothetical protein